MKLFDIDDPTRFYTLVVRDQIFRLLELLKKDEWKSYNKKLTHSFLKIRIDIALICEVVVDDYVLILSPEEQEAINYAANKMYKRCETLLHKTSYEKLRQELKRYDENYNCSN